jgi:hypothetical protein|tara:strand:- start:5306 stop:5446 length:141 start_codon:yes stop_codon:yes gene_type:complete
MITNEEHKQSDVVSILDRELQIDCQPRDVGSGNVGSIKQRQSEDKT